MSKHGIKMRSGRPCFLTVLLAAILVTDASAITWGKMIEFGTGVSVESMRRTTDGGVVLNVSQRHVAKLNSNGENIAG